LEVLILNGLGEAGGKAEGRTMKLEIGERVGGVHGERTKEGAPFSAAKKSKGSIAEDILVVKSNIGSVRIEW
jgi:hypothetical protein